LIAVKQLHFAAKDEQLRAQLGNDIAINALKEGTLPFPDGAIVASINRTRVVSDDNDEVLDIPFPGTQLFVIGSRLNVQFMVKDSKKYAATGRWGFADFTDGKPGDTALHETCFPCHIPAKESRLRLHRVPTLMKYVSAQEISIRLISHSIPRLVTPSIENVTSEPRQVRTPVFAN
jgi:Cytochrome P460